MIIEATIFEDVHIQIYNSMGKMVYQKTQLMDKKLELDVTILEFGNYYLDISNAKTGVSIYQQSIVKIK